LLSRESVRQNPQALYWTCALVVMGFLSNRLNVAVTAFERSSGFYYVPKWPEFALTLATVTACAVAFHYAVRYLDILPKNAPAKNFAVGNVATA
jgi:Ni/Fe-hydrogenase subunit HybB-like protein